VLCLLDKLVTHVCVIKVFPDSGQKAIFVILMINKKKIPAMYYRKYDSRYHNGFVFIFAGNKCSISVNFVVAELSVRTLKI
jgi:hypothetical protein